MWVPFASYRCSLVTNTIAEFYGHQRELAFGCETTEAIPTERTTICAAARGSDGCTWI